MLNINCLEHMWCPECGSLGPFRISAAVMVLVYDDGTDDDEMNGDTEWDEKSYCECKRCRHSGTVVDFTFGEITLNDVPADDAEQIAQKYAGSLLGREFYVGMVSALTDKWNAFESSDDERVLFKVRSKTSPIDAVSWADDDIIDVALDVEVIEDPEGVLPKSMFGYRIFPRSYKIYRQRVEHSL